MAPKRDRLRNGAECSRASTRRVGRCTAARLALISQRDRNFLRRHVSASLRSSTTHQQTLHRWRGAHGRGTHVGQMQDALSAHVRAHLVPASVALVIGFALLACAVGTAETGSGAGADTTTQPTDPASPPESTLPASNPTSNGAGADAGATGPDSGAAKAPAGSSSGSSGGGSSGSSSSGSPPVEQLVQLVEQRRKQLRRRVHRSCGTRRDRYVQRLRYQARMPGQRLLRRLLVQSLDDEVRRDACGLLSPARVSDDAARLGARRRPMRRGRRPCDRSPNGGAVAPARGSLRRRATRRPFRARGSGAA